MCWFVSGIPGVGRHATANHRRPLQSAAREQSARGRRVLRRGKPAFHQARTLRQDRPPSLPCRSQLVVISGLFEILGGFGVLVPQFRRAATWGVVALLIAVFPVNIYMATNPVESGAASIAPVLRWGRLPPTGARSGRARIARHMKDVGARELIDVRITAGLGTGKVRIGADGSAQHDDLVIALALACWRARWKENGFGTRS